MAVDIFAVLERLIDYLHLHQGERRFFTSLRHKSGLVSTAITQPLNMFAPFWNNKLSLTMKTS